MWPFKRDRAKKVPITRRRETNKVVSLQAVRAEKAAVADVILGDIEFNRRRAAKLRENASRIVR